MNRFSKTSAAVLLSASFFLTGCGSTAPDTTPTASASATESAATGMEADISRLFASPYGQNVLVAFPDEEYGTKEAVKVAVEDYKSITTTRAFHHVRDSSKDYEILKPFESKLDPQYRESVKQNIVERGRWNHVLTTPGDGKITHIDKTEYVLDDSGELTADFASPTVVDLRESLHSDSPEQVLYVEGLRTYSYPLEGGLEFRGTDTYQIELIPADAKGEWIIKRLGTKGLTVDVLPASEKQ